MCVGKFGKEETFCVKMCKMLKTTCERNLFFTSFKPTILRKKHFCGYITRNPSRF